MNPRIAVGGLHTECSTYNPVRMQHVDFRILRGPEITDHPDFAELRCHEAQFLPTLHARAIAGGPIARPVYDAFKAEFLARLEAELPLDALYLAMHGAVFVDGMQDAEADWIQAARQLVGPDCLIGAGYDLHGNLSQPIIDAIDVFSTYRTAPHVDQRQTQRRVLAMLLRALNGTPKPGILWTPIPILWPGERTSTTDQPARDLYAALPAIEAHPGIWDASFQIGYVWADEPRATACAILTGTDPAALAHHARSLAQRYWDHRAEFVFGTPTGSIAQCIAQALASPTRPVILADSGDNPTGGGVGDRADLLAALLEANATETILAGIADAPATGAAYAAGQGAQIRTPIGATLDPASIPITIDATIQHLHPTTDPTDRQAVLRTQGIDLVITARRRPFHHIADFTALGLDPTTARIICVKSGYLSPELTPLAKPALMALSPGVVDQDVAHLPRHQTPPTYPGDRDLLWSPTTTPSKRAFRK